MQGCVLATSRGHLLVDRGLHLPPVARQRVAGIQVLGGGAQRRLHGFSNMHCAMVWRGEAKKKGSHFVATAERGKQGLWIAIEAQGHSGLNIV